MRALVVVVGGLTACYSPELRDCTVSCAAAMDCAGGQVCGSDGFCASPEVAGRCAGTDGSVAADARVLPILDASLTGELRLKITGKGTLELVGLGTCDPEQHPDDCTYPVTLGVALTLHASPHSDHTFETWTSVACGGQGATCVTTPILPVTDIAAKFRKIAVDD